MDYFNDIARDLADIINRAKFFIDRFKDFGPSKGQVWGPPIGNHNGPYHCVLHERDKPKMCKRFGIREKLQRNAIGKLGVGLSESVMNFDLTRPWQLFRDHVISNK